RGRAAVDDRSGPLRRAGRLAPRLAQDPGEGEVNPSERPQRAGAQPGRRPAEGLDQLAGALVPLAALADAPVDDLLQLVAAREVATLGRADPGPCIALHEHPQELPDLVDVVTGLPLRNESSRDLARGHAWIEGARPLGSSIADRTDDPEIPELQVRAVAHE